MVPGLPLGGTDILERLKGFGVELFEFVGLPASSLKPKADPIMDIVESRGSLN